MRFTIAQTRSNGRSDVARLARTVGFLEAEPTTAVMSDRPLAVQSVGLRRGGRKTWAVRLGDHRRQPVPSVVHLCVLQEGTDARARVVAILDQQNGAERVAEGGPYAIRHDDEEVPGLHALGRDVHLEIRHAQRPHDDAQRTELSRLRVVGAETETGRLVLQRVEVDQRLESPAAQA